jgi:ubiquinone/menaquinone biosynthesis C-methylase UbiE
MSKKLIILLIVAFTGLTSATQKPGFSDKAYGNVANFFEDENDMRSFFDFHKGDIVAEVGTGHGYNICGFSILADNTTFYMQDIDTTVLNQKQFEKVIKRCKKFKNPLTNKFYLCIGTEKSTNLPANSFDKIILISTFHEFTHIDDMMTDIYSKLKPNGQLYILEAHCFSHKTNYTADETIAMMKKYNFALVKKDGKDLHRSTGLYRTIFKKNNFTH